MLGGLSSMWWLQDPDSLHLVALPFFLFWSYSLLAGGWGEETGWVGPGHGCTSQYSIDQKQRSPEISRVAGLWSLTVCTEREGNEPWWAHSISLGPLLCALNILLLLYGTLVPAPWKSPWRSIQLNVWVLQAMHIWFMRSLCDFLWSGDLRVLRTRLLPSCSHPTLHPAMYMVK